MVSQTFTLKVSLNESCQLKAKRELETIRGVDSVSVKKDFVTISGSINPSAAIIKFGEWGEIAELLSVVKDHDDDNNNNDDETTCDKKRCCSKSVAKESRRHQTEEYHQMTELPTQGKNRSSLRWFGKKLGKLINPWHSKSSAAPDGDFSPRKWRFPTQEEYAASISPFGNQFRPQVEYEPLPQPPPLYQVAPPPMPYQPMAPPSMAYQPMPPSTSYTDNHRPWYG